MAGRAEINCKWYTGCLRERIIDGRIDGRCHHRQRPCHPREPEITRNRVCQVQWKQPLARELLTEFGKDGHKSARDGWLVTERVWVSRDVIFSEKIDEQQARFIDVFRAGSEWPLHRQLDGPARYRTKHRQAGLH